MWVGSITGWNPFGTMSHGKSDAEATGKAKSFEPIDYPKPDGVLSFDRLTNVSFSMTNHEESQPAHLTLKEASVPISVNWPEYAEPAQRYCPAGGLRSGVGGGQGTALRHQLPELRALQDLRYQGSLAEHPLDGAAGRGTDRITPTCDAGQRPRRGFFGPARENVDRWFAGEASGFRCPCRGRGLLSDPETGWRPECHWCDHLDLSPSSPRLPLRALPVPTPRPWRRSFRILPDPISRPGWRCATAITGRPRTISNGPCARIRAIRS